MTATFSLSAHLPAIKKAEVEPGSYPPEIEEKIRNWTWIYLSELAECVDVVAPQQAMIDVRITKRRGLDLLKSFGCLMSDRRYPLLRKFNYLIEGGDCRIGAEFIPTDDKINILVPAGWANTVLNFAEQGVISVSVRENDRKAFYIASFYHSSARIVVREKGDPYAWSLTEEMASKYMPNA